MAKQSPFESISCLYPKSRNANCAGYVQLAASSGPGLPFGFSYAFSLTLRITLWELGSNQQDYQLLPAPKSSSAAHQPRIPARPYTMFPFMVNPSLFSRVDFPPVALDILFQPPTKTSRFQSLPMPSAPLIAPFPGKRRKNGGMKRRVRKSAFNWIHAQYVPRHERFSDSPGG